MRALCFRGAPIEQCRSFLLTETTFYLHIPDSGESAQLGWQLGGMRNLSRKIAAGGTLVVGPYFREGGAALRYGLLARLGLWLSPRLRLDLDGGWSSVPPDRSWDGSGRSEGVALSAAVSYRDGVGLALMFERVQARPATTGIGLRLGSYPNMVVHGIGAGLLLVLVLALVASDGCPAC
jgi:hypothetical protein